MVTALQLELSVASTLLSLLAALVAKPSPFRCLFLVPIILGEAYSFRSELQFQYLPEWCLAGAFFSHIFIASDYVLLTDVQCELFCKGQKEPAFRLSLFERIKWGASLLINLRCVGWSHEPTYALPPRPLPSVTRQKFISQELGRLAQDLIVFELFATYAKRSGYFSSTGRSMAVDGPFWRMVNVLVCINSALALVNIGHRSLGILGVLLSYVEPQDWVPMFGSRRDAYTLQKFWGRVWHQGLRRQLTSHGRYLAYDVLRLKKGTKASFYVQLYVAFAISAMIHVAADYSLLGNWLQGGALRFFLLQAVGITVETTVIDIAKWLSIRGSWHYLGYVWVILWFTYTVPDWMDPLHRAGWADATFNFSISTRILEWVHPS